MPDRVEELAAQGFSLPPAERMRLLDLLLDSLNQPRSDAEDDTLKVEISRRVAAHERGEGRL
ncbi:addiction module protein [Ideonella sp.]|jgi:putative addiction module component (TIGR02574 family)|uniref:addiction module protein n=1 Tax=Ideonella sp. TaxID=1929293 RepID=UPI0037C19D21